MTGCLLAIYDLWYTKSDSHRDQIPFKSPCSIRGQEDKQHYFSEYLLQFLNNWQHSPLSSKSRKKSINMKISPNQLRLPQALNLKSLHLINFQYKHQQPSCTQLSSPSSHSQFPSSPPNPHPTPTNPPHST